MSGFNTSGFPHGERIYLDGQQCLKFQMPYFGEGFQTVHASTILRFKAYDERHCACLESLGDNKVVLGRTADDDPGWYTILATVI